MVAGRYFYGVQESMIADQVRIYQAKGLGSPDFRFRRKGSGKVDNDEFPNCNQKREKATDKY